MTAREHEGGLVRAARKAQSASDASGASGATAASSGSAVRSHGARPRDVRPIDRIPSADEVRSYLRDNHALRDALGIGAHTELLPTPLGAGEHNLNFRVGHPGKENAFVLRINLVPQPFHDHQLAYEYAALQALAPSGCTPVPLYLDESAEPFAYGAMAISFCPGRMLDFDRQRDGDAEAAARLMARIHAVPAPPSCPIYKPADAARELYDECVGRFDLYRSSDAQDKRVTLWTERFFDRAHAALSYAADEADTGCIVNTEPLATHFLLPDTHRAGRAGTGGFFVDWERPIRGEAAQDLAFFIAPSTTYWDSSFFFTRKRAMEVVECYRAAAEGSVSLRSFDTRLETYLALSTLRAVTWCCRARARLSADPRSYLTPKARMKLDTYLSDDFLDTIYRW